MNSRICFGPVNSNFHFEDWEDTNLQVPGGMEEGVQEVKEGP